MGVEGETLMNEPGGKTQDFLLINQPMFAFPNVHEYLEFTRIQFANKEDVRPFFAPQTLTDARKKIGGIVQKIATMHIANPLDAPYFSASAFLLGPENAAKFAARPRGAPANPSLPDGLFAGGDEEEPKHYRRQSCRLRFPDSTAAGRPLSDGRRLSDRKRQRRMETKRRRDSRLSECCDDHDSTAGFRHSAAKHRVRTSCLYPLAWPHRTPAAGRHQPPAPRSIYRLIQASRGSSRANGLSEVAVLKIKGRSGRSLSQGGGAHRRRSALRITRDAARALSTARPLASCGRRASSAQGDR
jgi:hypothetical protein